MRARLGDVVRWSVAWRGCRPCCPKKAHLRGHTWLGKICLSRAVEGVPSGGPSNSPQCVAAIPPQQGSVSVTSPCGRHTLGDRPSQAEAPSMCPRHGDVCSVHGPHGAGWGTHNLQLWLSPRCCPRGLLQVVRTLPAGHPHSRVLLGLTGGGGGRRWTTLEGHSPGHRAERLPVGWPQPCDPHSPGRDRGSGRAGASPKGRAGSAATWPGLAYRCREGVSLGGSPSWGWGERICQHRCASRPAQGWGHQPLPTVLVLSGGLELWPRRPSGVPACPSHASCSRPC